MAKKSAKKPKKADKKKGEMQNIVAEKKDMGKKPPFVKKKGK